MTKRRRKYTQEFKARVALDVMSGEYTVAELAVKYNIHPNNQWLNEGKRK